LFQKFPEREDLLRNMLGLLGNVAEVKSLRPHLMNSKFISVFTVLLQSYENGIDVSIDGEFYLLFLSLGFDTLVRIFSKDNPISLLVRMDLIQRLRLG